MKPVQFLREVRAEMTKVTWPSMKDTRSLTLMVFVLVFLVSAYLWVVDFALSSGVRFIIGA
jgi:preprotein translocase subunit SecE